ncbi:MAG: hypothetical protein Phyf2KO_25790 [Phycisphaerales bacterium]
MKTSEQIDWVPLAPKAMRHFARQLRREIPRRDHVLSDEFFVLIAQDASSDDVLLALPARNQWAICHLTWSKRREQPPWPVTVVSDSLQELVVRTLES